jgi:gluconokinase
MLAAAAVTGVSDSDKAAAGAVPTIRPDGVFADGGALHSPANIAKTRTGEPLGNFDHAPWLSAIPTHVDDWRAAESAKGMPCSALKHGYRDAIIKRWNEVSLVYFKGSSTLIGKHLVARRGSPSPASPLEHQIATVCTSVCRGGVDRGGDDRPIEAVVAYIVTALSLRQESMTVPA